MTDIRAEPEKPEPKKKAPRRSNMTPEQAQAVVDMAGQGMTDEEIAKVSGWSVPTVRNRRYAAGIKHTAGVKFGADKAPETRKTTLTDVGPAKVPESGNKELESLASTVRHLMVRMDEMEAGAGKDESPLAMLSRVLGISPEEILRRLAK